MESVEFSLPSKRAEFKLERHDKVISKGNSEADGLHNMLNTPFIPIIIQMNRRFLAGKDNCLSMYDQ